MAVELCSDNSGMSPRISFSLDLCHFDEVPVDRRPLRSSKPSSLNSSIDFDFCVGESIEQQQPSSSADELFSDGKILPTCIKKNNVPSKQTDHQSSLPPLPPPPHDEVNINSTKGSRNEDEQKQSSSKSSSFWGFKRSRSFSCGSGYGRSLCPLPLLSRSNSTGSTPNPKQSSNNPKQINPHKHTSTNYQKPPLKKSSGAYKPYGNNGVHVNPVILNVPSANLFGLGSIFFNGKAKNHQCKRK
ncbi:cysteine-rich receptor-like protein kinase 26-like [Hibiscus syriacus]|uniref:Cysteine-rich receptor-like protein kinase 26-like n=1 Tax=Hibiscus syriacus TaxID=106335 RepID=A0A6A3BAC0_HIBSY|nr:uncharacterized protein LOC120113714 [Hibiscus syriacus]KAE8713343.1 cysteine-rich receptor-like protein kinase 26-like [Hibiscus syriacus]